MKKVCFLLTVIAAFMSHGVIATELVAEDVRWRAPIPGQTVGAVYMSLKNVGSEDTVLTSLKVDWAKKAEFHEHRHSNGMMQMRQVNELIVPANGSLKLVPGGYHIMVFGVPADLSSDGLSIELIDHQGEATKVHIKN